MRHIGLINSGEISKVRDKYSKFDKIYNLGSKIDDFTKFNLINDFYILIGQVGKFCESDFRQYSDNIWEKEKNALVFSREIIASTKLL